MNTLIVILLGVLCVLVAVNLVRNRAVPAPPPPTPTDPALLTSEINRTVGDALSNALRALDERARLDREESIRMATDLVAEKSGEQLGNRASMIDQSLRNVKDEVSGKLLELDRVIQNLRETSSGQYHTIEKAVSALAERTENLKEVLSSSQARGQWGERLAEDMLRQAGFIEGINYHKQTIIDGGGRPDYRFDMPPDRVLFMDVKFPLDKYAEFVAASTDAERERAKIDFVGAVKRHVDALAKRDYVDKSTDNTVDYVLMFVPNESISGFVHEASPTLIDYALERKVVLCSPLTLYAFLVVIRQAADSFHTEQTAVEIMQYVNLFHKQWGEYTEAVDRVQKSFEKLVGDVQSINSDGTRFNKLNAQIKKIEALRKKRGIAELPAGSVPDDQLDA